MKKSLLALVLPSLFASTVGAVEVYKDDGQSVDLYGRAYAGHNFGSEDSDEYGNDSYIRIGAKLKSDISDSLSAFGRYELQWDLAEGEKQEKTKTRLAYAGIKSEVGAFSFGRQYGAVELVADLTDNAYTNAYGNAALAVGKDHDGTGRDNSLLKYSNKFAGVQLDASYRFDDNQSDTESDAAYGLAAAYELDFGLTLAAGFNASSPTDDYDASIFLVGASYKTGPVKVAATFAQGAEFEGQNIDHTGYELTVEYKITKQLRAQVLYNAQEIEDTTTSVTEDAVDDLVFGVRYDFNKKFRTVAEYRINGVEGKDDDFHLAARYSF